MHFYFGLALLAAFWLVCNWRGEPRNAKTTAAPYVPPPTVARRVLPRVRPKLHPRQPRQASQQD